MNTKPEQDNWNVDESGNIVSKKGSVMCPIVGEWEAPSDLPDMIEVDGWSTLNGGVVGYHVNLDAEGEGGIYVELSDVWKEMQEAFDQAEPDEAQARMQMVILDHALACLDDFDSAPARIRGAIARIEAGVTISDLLWEDTDGVTYDADHWTVRVFETEDEGVMVCYESDSTDAEIAAYGHISNEEWDDLEYDPSNTRGFMLELMEMAGVGGR